MRNSWQKVLACTVALLALMHLAVQSNRFAGLQSPPLQRLTAVRFEGGLVGRSVLQLEAGPCVILRVAEHHEPEIDWGALEASDQLHSGDIVEFSIGSGPHATILHMGRILKTDAGNVLLSKFGRGPIVQSTLEAAGNLYNASPIVVHRAQQ